MALSNCIINGHPSVLSAAELDAAYEHARESLLNSWGEDGDYERFIEISDEIVKRYEAHLAELSALRDTIEAIDAELKSLSL
jgi:hypothetical protein